MPRRLRFAPPGYWLHLTQRGNNKQSVVSTDTDRQHFLDLVEQHSEEREVRVAAYTLISNSPVGATQHQGDQQSLNQNRRARAPGPSGLPQN